MKHWGDCSIYMIIFRMYVFLPGMFMNFKYMIYDNVTDN